MASSSSSSLFDYDYLVIGGGSGGVSSAKRAAQLYGKKVAIIESQRWGGTCVNVGCVPKKIMFQTAAVLESVRHAATEYEIVLPTGATAAADDSSILLHDASVNWKSLKYKRDAYIVRLNNIYESGLKAANVTSIAGYGSFVGPNTVQIKMDNGSESRQITAEHIVIATGGKPTIPPGDGIIEHCITSDGFFDLEEQPATAVVVGAGYIAVELAGVLNALGTKTHLVVRKHKALREFDPDISDFLDARMAHDGIIIHRNTNGVAKVEIGINGKKIVTCHDGTTVIPDVDIVLMAPGREANVDGLNLTAVAVQQNSKGDIVVDDYQNTSTPGIYAVGDVAGKVLLTPMAIAAGRRLADRLFGIRSESDPVPRTSYENVPTVVFSHPTIGTVGFTEPQAIEKFGTDNLKIYRSTFVNLFYSMYDMDPSDKPKTLVKVICAGIQEQVVGLHIIGDGADEMLQGFGLGMKMGMTKADLDSVIAIHPTAAEEVVTLGTWGTSAPYSGAAVPPLMGASAPVPTLTHPKPPSNL